VKATRLVGVPGGAPDPDHHFVARDKGGDQRAAAGAALLSDRECRRQHCGAGMRPRPRAGQAVELKGMCERAVGEGGGGRLDRRAAAAEDVAVAAGSGALGVADDDPAPRQGGTADRRRNRVGDALLRQPHDLCRQILVPQSSRVLGEPDGFLRHDLGPPG